ncbi:hypothetical protein Dimus_029044 [Dionaea muscipula]
MEKQPPPSMNNSWQSAAAAGMAQTPGGIDGGAHPRDTQTRQGRPARRPPLPRPCSQSWSRVSRNRHTAATQARKDGRQPLTTPDAAQSSVVSALAIDAIGPFVACGGKQHQQRRQSTTFTTPCRQSTPSSSNAENDGCANRRPAARW